MKLNINITSITIITGRGTDKVCLNTDMPAAFAADVCDEPNTFQFQAAAGHGEAYVAEHFPGVDVEVIAMSKGY